MKKVKNILYKQKGYTLVEVLIALALFSILSLSVWSIMDHTTKNAAKVQNDIEVIENARITLDFMIEEIRRARGIVIPFSSSPFYTLELDMNGDKEIKIDGKNLKKDVIFTLDGNKVKYNTYQVLAENITDIEFTVSDDDILTIKITAKKDDREYQITGEISIKYKKKINNE